MPPNVWAEYQFGSAQTHQINSPHPMGHRNRCLISSVITRQSLSDNRSNAYLWVSQLSALHQFQADNSSEIIHMILLSVLGCVKAYNPETMSSWIYNLCQRAGKYCPFFMISLSSGWCVLCYCVFFLPSFSPTNGYQNKLHKIRIHFSSAAF